MALLANMSANMSAVGISNSWVWIIALRGWGAVHGVSSGFADGVEVGEGWTNEGFWEER
jgi:hypothetical protein